MKIKEQVKTEWVSQKLEAKQWFGKEYEAEAETEAENSRLLESLLYLYLAYPIIYRDTYTSISTLFYSLVFDNNRIAEKLWHTLPRFAGALFFPPSLYYIWEVFSAVLGKNIPGNGDLHVSAVEYLGEYGEALLF